MIFVYVVLCSSTLFFPWYSFLIVLLVVSWSWLSGWFRVRGVYFYLALILLCCSTLFPGIPSPFWLILWSSTLFMAITIQSKLDLYILCSLYPSAVDSTLSRFSVQYGDIPSLWLTAIRAGREFIFDLARCPWSHHRQPRRLHVIWGKFNFYVVWLGSIYLISFYTEYHFLLLRFRVWTSSRFLNPPTRKWCSSWIATPTWTRFKFKFSAFKISRTRTFGTTRRERCA